MKRRIDSLLHGVKSDGDHRPSVVGASFFSMSTRLAQVLLQFVTVVVLARFLTPSDFGLYGMVTPLVAFFLVLRDAGLGMATLQSTTLSERQASTLFYTNVLVGFALSVMFVLSAGLVARFYGEPGLVDIVIALSVMFLFSGVRVQLEALVFRGYRFQSVFVMEIIASSLAFLISAAVALKGYGYWALCARQLTYEIAYTSSLFIYVRWIPRSFRMDRETFSLFKFGVNAVLSNFVVYFLRNIDNVLIGWKYGPAVLGPYSLGYRTVLLPIQQVVTPLSRVFIPHLSQQQHDPVGFAKSYAHALRAMMFFVAPILAAVWICADEAINIMLGRQWHDAVPIIQWLIPAGVLQVAYLSAGWINFSRGRADRQLWWGLLSLPIVVGGFMIGLKWGGVGVAASYLITNAMLLIPLFVYSVRGTAITLLDIMRAVMPATIASVAVIGLGDWARYAAIDRGLSDAVVLIAVAAIAVMIMLAISPAVFGWANLCYVAGKVRARLGGVERPVRGGGVL